MDENHTQKSTPGQGHQKHPIVKRPDFLWDGDQDGFVFSDWMAKGVRTYIEHLEHDLNVTQRALTHAHTRLEFIYEKYGEDCENVR